MTSFRIVDFESLPSTQDEARRRVLSGEPVGGWVIRAGYQTAGRGQRARDWQAGLGGSYQTLIVRAPKGSSLLPAASLLMGLGLAEVLPRYGVKVGLKWPNDVYYRGKKLAGILTEQVAEYLLIGIGLNVNNEVPEGAVGLRGWDAEGAHMVVLEGLQQGLAHLTDPTFDLPAAFAPFDLLRGEALVLETPGRRHSGKGAGIDSQGRLLIADDVGQRLAFSSGRLTSFTLRRDLKVTAAG